MKHHAQDTNGWIGEERNGKPNQRYLLPDFRSREEAAGIVEGFRCFTLLMMLTVTASAARLVL